MTAMAPTDPVVLITGATGGLGRVVAPLFASEGWRLGLTSRDPTRLEALATELGLVADRWVPGIGDLATQDGARAAIGAVLDRFERIDAWLHLVGGWAGGTAIVDLDPDELRTMLDSHVWSTFHVAQVVVPDMVARGWGRIVAVTSPFAAVPNARGAAYAAAKAGEDTFVRALAREVANTGVTANLLVVRDIDTAHTRETEPTPRNATWTTPEEIGATLRFLCSDEAAALNGARIALDGR
jgi:NAD(P)-dependent dehydrogenase (short-subunit alcohol dehydrogenase family)